VCQNVGHACVCVCPSSLLPTETNTWPPCCLPPTIQRSHESTIVISSTALFDDGTTHPTHQPLAGTAHTRLGATPGRASARLPRSRSREYDTFRYPTSPVCVPSGLQHQLGYSRPRGCKPHSLCLVGRTDQLPHYYSLVPPPPPFSASSDSSLLVFLPSCISLLY
jgi:hypothetical protein